MVILAVNLISEQTNRSLLSLCATFSASSRASLSTALIYILQILTYGCASLFVAITDDVILSQAYGVDPTCIDADVIKSMPDIEIMAAMLKQASVCISTILSA